MSSASPHTMRVLGLMSGTSADGIDVALVRIAGSPPKIAGKVENFLTLPFAPAGRAAGLRVTEGQPTTTGAISQTNFFLGELVALPGLVACRRFPVAPQQIA